MINILVFLLFSGAQTPIVSTLINHANKAEKNNKTSKATTIYEAAQILAPNNKVVLSKLASLYLSTGRNRLALKLFKKINKFHCGALCKTNCFSKVDCSDFKINIIRIQKDTSESDRVPLEVKVPKIAKIVYSKALKAKRHKKYKSAINLFKASLKLNPDYVGVYRQLGELYNKLKLKDQADDFYKWYLKMRPAGPNAAKVRKKLSKKAKKTLGRLKLQSSKRCNIAIGSFLLTNTRGRPYSTPVKSVILPEGRYAIGFICQKQHLAQRLWVNIKSGKTQKLYFKFGTLSVKLNPWARILVAPTKGPRKGKYMDAGLFKVIGLPVGKYKLKLVAFNHKKTMTRDLIIKHKKHVKITRWKKK